ncbi:MAG TPA: HAMP domain-containing sensor histidine kinase [Phototrophicaceae bacterium]|nr:HAMP domain-containing sensor histidine kinase [Phototrophicaceae bacterium]
MDNNRSWVKMFGEVAHELKTPLTSAKGFLDLLQNSGEPLTAKQARWTNRAAEALDRMEQLVTDLLELAWIEAERPLELEPVDLADLIERCIEVMADTAERRPVTVHSEIEPDLGTIQADERRLEQVLLNLISNAIKYNKAEGKIWVTAQGTLGEVEVRVRDTGKGIAQEDQARVFEQFFRSPTEKIEGTGLGLSIVKGLVEKHGGRVWVESILGNGSTFGFTLPRQLRQSESSEGAREALTAPVEEAESSDFVREANSSEVLDAVDDNIQEPPQLYVDQDEPDVAEQP